MSLKAVIIVGGPQKGTRFRPLQSKPLFPVAGQPLIEHHIEQLCELKNLAEIFILGFYPTEDFTEFIAKSRIKYGIAISYLDEQGPSGTAGGLVKYKNEILRPVGAPRQPPEAIFVLNSDICGDLPIEEVVHELERFPESQCLILTTEATREQSKNYGCVVVDDKGEVLHYVDKPTTFVSTHISCGLYLMRPSIWPEHLESAAKSINGGSGQQLWFETDVFPQMASSKKLHALHTTRWWSQTKTPGAALYANRHYLRLYREHYPERLSTGIEAEIIGDVFIDPTAIVHKTAKIGPNVTISAGAIIGAGVRIRESIILPECVLEDHCCVLYSVIGWRCVLGSWSRVEGTPVAPNPNVPFAKLDNKPLFNTDGRLNPSLTILGSDVHELTTSKKNQIIL